MTFGGEERPRRYEADEDTGSTDTGRQRNRGPRGPWLPLLALALILALLIISGLIVWRSFGGSVSGTSVSRDSVNVGEKPSVRLSNGQGQILVEGVEAIESVEFEVTKHALGEDPAAAKKRASEVSVDISREDSVFVIETDGGRRTGADYVLRIPIEGSVEIRSEAGDIEVTNVNGDVKALAEAGDVTVRDSRGSVTVESPRGDVSISNVNTDTGQIELDIGSGDVTLEDLVVGTIEAHVEAGDITLLGRFSGGGRVFVETGDIIARIPPGDTRELDLESRIGGVVRGQGSEPEGEGSEGNDSKPKESTQPAGG